MYEANHPWYESIPESYSTTPNFLRCEVDLRRKSWREKRSVSALTSANLLNRRNRHSVAITQFDHLKNLQEEPKPLEKSDSLVRIMHNLKSKLTNFSLSGSSGSGSSGQDGQPKKRSSEKVWIAGNQNVFVKVCFSSDPWLFQRSTGSLSASPRPRRPRGCKRTCPLSRWRAGS